MSVMLELFQQYHDEIFAVIMIVGGHIAAGIIIYRDIKVTP